MQFLDPGGKCHHTPQPILTENYLPARQAFFATKGPAHAFHLRPSSWNKWQRLGTENLVNDASYLSVPMVDLKFPQDGDGQLPASSLRAVPAVAHAGRVKLHQVESLQLRTSYKYCAKSKLKLANSV